jgi:hypothetical protein
VANESRWRSRGAAGRRVRTPKDPRPALAPVAHRSGRGAPRAHGVPLGA